MRRQPIGMRYRISESPKKKGRSEEWDELIYEKYISLFFFRLILL